MIRDLYDVVLQLPWLYFKTAFLKFLAIHLIATVGSLIVDLLNASFLFFFPFLFSGNLFCSLCNDTRYLSLLLFHLCYVSSTHPILFHSFYTVENYLIAKASISISQLCSFFFSYPSAFGPAGKSQLFLQAFSD